MRRVCSVQLIQQSANFTSEDKCFAIQARHAPVAHRWPLARIQINSAPSVRASLCTVVQLESNCQDRPASARMALARTCASRTRSLVQAWQLSPRQLLCTTSTTLAIGLQQSRSTRALVEFMSGKIPNILEYLVRYNNVGPRAIGHGQARVCAAVCAD